MISKFFTFLTVTVLILMGVSTANADYIAPGTIRIKTPDYSFDPTPITPGKYLFDVSWQGIPVATAAVIVNQSAPNEKQKIEVNAKTNGVIDIFYRMRHRSESTFFTAPFHPVLYRSNEMENSNKRRREISFSDGGQITAKQWRRGKELQEMSFVTDNNTLDPISAAFIARNMPLSIGSESAVDVFNGKHRYLITFKVVSQEQVTLNDTVRDAFKVVPSVQKLTDTKGERRLNSAAIWIAADGTRDLLRLESKVWVGSVSAKFTNFIPVGGLEKPTPELLRARLAKPDEAQAEQPAEEPKEKESEAPAVIK